MSPLRVAVLSGGSEIVSVALVEEFLAAGAAPIIIALSPRSVLKGLAGKFPFYRLDWPPDDPPACAERLAEILRSEAASRGVPLPLFATEDGGLRLLLSQRAVLEPVTTFSRARVLAMGGLDKVELFNFLDRAGGQGMIPPFAVATTVAEALTAMDTFDADAVIKPALKPYGITLAGLKGKAVFTKELSGREPLTRHLTRLWPLADRWLVQPRLRVPEGGERSVWAVRDAAGHCCLLAVVNRERYPRYGGTSCWVEVSPGDRRDSELLGLAERVLRLLDFQGLGELEFMQDQEGRWRLVELNPRPWLQVGLAFRAGVPLATLAARVLAGGELGPAPRPEARDWVNVERLLLAAASGEQGFRPSALIRAIRIWRKAGTVAVHDSKLPGVRWRWVRNLLLRIGS